MIGTSDPKKGLSVEVDGTLYQIVDVHHVKTKRSAVYRVKLKDLRAGHITEHSFKAGEKLAAARVERPWQRRRREPVVRLVGGRHVAGDAGGRE